MQLQCNQGCQRRLAMDETPNGGLRPGQEAKKVNQLSGKHPGAGTWHTERIREHKVLERAEDADVIQPPLPDV